MRLARILVVDDEPNIRLMLRTALESEGYRVEEEADGQAALDFLDGEARVPDLMLLDLSMPVLDGMKLLELLHERPAERRPRVVVLTAYGSVSAAVKAIRLGARDFLEKPVTPEELRLSVASVLDEPADGQDVREPDLSYSEVLAQVRRDLFEGNLPHAEALLMRAADLAGTDPTYFNLLGVLHEAQGRKTVARKFYGKAIRANSKCAAAQQNMRRLFELERFGSSREEVALGDEILPPGGGPPRGPAEQSYAERLRKLLGRNGH